MQQLLDASEAAQAELIAGLVRRIDVHRDRLELILHSPDDDAPVLTASATLIRSGLQTRLVPPGVQPEASARRDEPLIRLVANAHAARLAVAAAGDGPLTEVAADTGSRCTTSRIRHGWVALRRTSSRPSWRADSRLCYRAPGWPGPRLFRSTGPSSAACSGSPNTISR